MTDRMAGFIVVIVVVAAYAASLPGTFQFDDQPTILGNPAIADSGNLHRYFVDPALFSGIKGNGMYRPVLLVTYAANWEIAGFRPFVWHLTNILLHALNAVLVVMLTRRLLVVFRPGSPAGAIPLLAGLAFALHPVHTEVVNYISSRSGAIATVGFLGALILHLAWTRGKRPPGSRAALLTGSMLLLVIGYGGKEIVAALVPVIFVLEFIAPDHVTFRRRCLRTVVRVAPAMIVTIGYLYLRKELMGSTGVNVTARMFEVPGHVDLNWGGGRTVFQNLITQSRVFWIYAGLLLFPLDLAVDRFVRVSTSLTEPQVIASLLGIAVVVALLLYAVRRAPLITLCGAIYFFGLAPTSSFVPLNVVMNEHRLYLPGVGIAILAALGLGALIRKWPKPAVTGAVAVGACWLVIVFTRSLVWQDPMKLWTESARVSPLSFRSHNQIGVTCRDQALRLGGVPAALPLLEKALEEFRIASEIYPRWPSADLNLGITYRDRASISGEDADFEASLAKFQTFRELSKDEWRARLEVAATYGRWNKLDESMRLYREMANEDRDDPDGPRNPLYLRPMAKMSVDQGDLDGAEALYREILKTRENDLDALLGLSRMLADSNRLEEAQALWMSLFTRKPDHPLAHVRCAKFLAGLTPPDRRGASAHFQQALRLGYRPTPEEFDLYLK